MEPEQKQVPGQELIPGAYGAAVREEERVLRAELGDLLGGGGARRHKPGLGVMGSHSVCER